MIEQYDPMMFTSSGKPNPGAPVDPEKLAYESPKAMINSIAKNILNDHLRKSKSEKDAVDGVTWETLKHQSPDASPDAHVWARETQSRYLAALREVPPLQRAAWILCRDPLLLSDDEAVALLEPALTGPPAKLAVKERPMSVEDAAQLFGRDVSPDAAKANRKLGALLFPGQLDRAKRGARRN